MTDRTSARREAVRWLVPLTILLAAAVATLFGQSMLALVGLVVGLVVVFVVLGTPQRMPSGPPPELTPEEAGMIHARRERDGEIAAVRCLRTLHPQLSLVEAVELVRTL